MSKNRKDRIRIAEETVKIVKDGYYIDGNNNRIDISDSIALCCKNTELILPNDRINFKKPSENKCTNISVTDETTLQAAKRLYNELNECKDGQDENQLYILNFASAKNAGGGFLRGSIAQEESLASCSALYESLMQDHCQKYYQLNRKTKDGYYTDHMILSPNTTVFRDDKNYQLLSIPYNITFVTVPAVNAGVVINRSDGSVNEINSKIQLVMTERIRRVLSLALNRGYKRLILGAFGCGVFKNDPHMVSTIFKQLLENEFSNVFEDIIFAIPAGNRTRNHETFANNLKSIITN